MPNAELCGVRRAADIMDERGKQYDKPDGERSESARTQGYASADDKGKR